MDEKAVNFLRKCIEIYSPSGQEKEYADFLADFLKNNGFKVKFDQIGNLIAEKGEGKPELLLLSHMDTIPGKLPIKEEDGKLYGRGAVDCKPSLAAMVYALSRYDFSHQASGKIIFGGIVREEESLEGIIEFIKQDINPDYSIFGEPTRIDQICIGYKGRLCAGYRIKSSSGHVASSWQYVNSIEIGLQIWNLVKGVCWQLNQTHCQKKEKTKHFDQIIPNITVISGGHLTNCVPDECILQIDIRFPPSIQAQVIIDEIRKSIINFRHVYMDQTKNDFKIQENISSFIEGFEIDGDNLLVGALRWAIFKTIKEKPVLIKKTGTTFINQIGIEYGIPSITYGPGDPKLEHTDQEHVEIKEFLDCVEVYLKFIDKFFELYQRKKSN